MKTCAIRWLGILLALVSIFVQLHAGEQINQQPAPASEDLSINVQYTGRLLGYFRQDLSQWQKENCIRPGGVLNHDCAVRSTQQQVAEPLTRVKQFWCATRGQQDVQKCTLTDHTVPTLLLGMGDNFAPQLPARIHTSWWDGNRFISTRYDPECGLLPLQAFNFEASGKSAAIRYSGDHSPANCTPAPLTLDDPRLTEAIEDNVANFLLLSGYRAVVPGREDFQYGAVWLYKLARSLALTSKPLPAESQETLHMLAANLRVKPCGPNSSLSNCTQVKDTDKTGKDADKTQSAKGACPLFFAKDLRAQLPTLVGCDSKLTSEDKQENVGYTIVPVTVIDAAGKLVSRNVLVIGLVDGPNSIDPTADLTREIPNNKQIISDPACSQTPTASTCKRYRLVVTKPADELGKILYETDRKYPDT